MKRRRVQALIQKEFRELLRDPVTVTLALLMPVVMLFLFGYAVNLDVEKVRLGIVDQDQSAASRALVSRFDSSPYFDLIENTTSTKSLHQALQASRWRVGIVIPAGFHRHLLDDEDAPVQVIVDGSFPVTARLAAAYADAIIMNFPEIKRRAIQVDARVWYNPAMRSINFVVPGLFAVILMAFPPLLTALAVVREKETGTIQQIYASPVTSAEFIFGKLVPYAIVAFVEILMVIVIGFLWFDVPFRGSATLLLVASLIYVMTTVGIGLLVSAISRTQLTAMLIALIVTLMPSFLFSGFLFPIFTMPVSLQLYSQLFPAGYFMDVSRSIVLKSAGLADVMPNLLLLVGYTLLVFLFSTWRMKQKVA